MAIATPDDRKGGLPRISIVTPCLNQSRYLEQAILSVLGQEYPNLEYIVIDGGSTDGSVEIIERHADHLHFWCSEKDGGHHDAINKGFSHASGDILAWLNSDDLYLEGALHAVAAIFSAYPDIDWITSLQRVVLYESAQVRKTSRVPGYSLEAFLDGVHLQPAGFQLGFIQQESTFWRRSLWQKAGGQLAARDLAADFDLWRRFYRVATLYGVDAPLAVFRKHDANRSTDIKRYVAQAEASLEVLRTELAWEGHDLRFRVLDGLCRIPGLGRSLRRLSGKWGAAYTAMNLYPEHGPAGRRWVLRTTKY